jgi:hypothetical protein
MQRCNGLDLVGHGHGVHEAGDGITINDRRLRLAVNGDDAASEGVTFRSGRLGEVARNRKESAGKDEGDQKSIESMFIHVVNTVTPRETLVPCLHVVRGAASV